MSDEMNSNYDSTNDDDLLFGDDKPKGPRDYYGTIILAAIEDMYVNGPGSLRRFDHRSDSSEHKTFRISLNAAVWDTKGSTFAKKQEDLAFGAKWKTTKPSLKVLGIVSKNDLLNLNGAWVRFTEVLSGRKYINKTTGEEVAEKAWSFKAIYADEEECRAAFEESVEAYKSGRQAKPTVAPDVSENTDQEQAVSSPEDNRRAMVAMLQSVYKSSGGSELFFKSLYSSNKSVQDVFTFEEALAAAKAENLKDEDLPF